MTDQPEYLKFVTTSTRKGPELEALAEKLVSELPKACIDRCGMAFALQCAISDPDAWWLPRTPRGVRVIDYPIAGGHHGTSSDAEFALRSVVKKANQQNCQGPKGENDSVCGIDPRDIAVADYDNNGY